MSRAPSAESYGPAHARERQRASDSPDRWSWRRPASQRRKPFLRVVSLEVLDQAGVERYIRSFYASLSATWRKRATIVGIHDYSEVNRNRSTETSAIIRSVRRCNNRTKLWFTETGALASSGRSFPHAEAGQASRIRNMFTYASRYRGSGVDRVYSYNWSGIETGPSCGSTWRYDAGLVNADGSLRPVYLAFVMKLGSYSR